MFTTVNYEYADLFTKDKTDKQLSIVSDDGLININNTELHQQQFQLTESLCSEEELRFGSCEASEIRFTISNTFMPLTGKWITVTMVVEGHTDKPFQIGRYKVVSDTAIADRTKREIIAYDAMHDILNADMAAWYNKVFPSKYSTLKLKQFRTSFLNHFGLEQVIPSEGLVNDNILVERTIAVTANSESSSETGYESTIGETLSGKDIITAICEINGCFGHIGRDGKFHYIYLPQSIQGLYPADFLFPDHVPEQWNYLPQAKTGHLYPQNPTSINLGGGLYITSEYEDFVVKTIEELQIRQEENDIGVIVGKSGGNSYAIEGNFLVYGKGTNELQLIANNILAKITDIVYRPFNADCKGNPCIEVGDPVRLGTKYELVESYVLQRTLKGIQALRDDYSAAGTEAYVKQVNGVHNSIMQLKGMSNTLSRTIEETQSTITNVNKNLQSQITQNAESITAEVKRATASESNLSTELTTKTEQLSSTIKQTADSITTNVNKQITETKEYADNAANTVTQATDEKLKKYSTTTEMNSAISQTASNINLSVSQKIQETREYANTQATNAQNAANAATDNKLKSYSTTVQMNSAINLSAEGIKTEASKTYETITNASREYTSMKSSITQNAESIKTKVTKGTVSSEISQEAGKISIKSNRFELMSDNLQITTDGKLTVKGNGVIKGTRLEGCELYSGGSGGRYVEIKSGSIRGGGSWGETGYLSFGSTLDGQPSLDIRAENLILSATKFAIGESKDQTSGLAIATQGYDCKYVVQIIDNGNGTITWTTSTLKFRNGILIGH